MSAPRSTTGKEFQADWPVTVEARQRYVLGQSRGMILNCWR